jgi:hypothetical protein
MDLVDGASSIAPSAGFTCSAQVAAAAMSAAVGLLP